MNTKEIEGPTLIAAVAIAVVLIFGIGFFLINRKDRPASLPGAGKNPGGATHVVGGVGAPGMGTGAPVPMPGARRQRGVD
jgi:hypothetical protein